MYMPIYFSLILRILMMSSHFPIKVCVCGFNLHIKDFLVSGDHTEVVLQNPRERINMSKMKN